MARMRGHRIPEKFNPFWEEQKLEDWEAWYHCGYEDGMSYIRFQHDLAEHAKLKEYIGQLESLIAANYRVMKEDIRKEFEKKQ